MKQLNLKELEQINAGATASQLLKYRESLKTGVEPDDKPTSIYVPLYGKYGMYITG